jgi:amino acid transporter
MSQNEPTSAPVTVIEKARRVIIGSPKDIKDKSVFHTLSLIPFLAWVGLGADGLSSSAYGPEEAFKALGEHAYIAVGLVALTAFTVFIISAAYRRIIEDFPHGGGGYVVATKLLGRQFGVVSGCALLVDYILTITVSIAAAGDAIFSILPLPYSALKMPFEICMILGLTTINIRGVKESVQVLAPIFLLFLLTHAIAIGWGIIGHLPEMPTTAASVGNGFRHDMSTIGFWPLFLMFIHAYSLGGGTYTGIEAVSNGLPIMREPRVETAKKTMTYMALSLAITASGLLLCYLLWQTHPVEGKTMNAVLLEKITDGIPGGALFVITCLFAEGFLLVVAAQAGFIDGPRVLANMAVDSWVPRRFAALSERLTTSNGIVLMGVTSLAALLYAHGNVSKLVVMYSINVFLTFSLSIFGMLKHYIIAGKGKKQRKRGILLFFTGFLLCMTILVITIIEKFSEGGWITLLVTSALIGLCFAVKKHYLNVAKTLLHLYSGIEKLPKGAKPIVLPIDVTARTAAILVGGYGGLGIQTLRNILKTFPGLYQNFIFVSIGVVDSGGFKGEDSVERLQENTKEGLEKYVDLAQKLGVAADYRMSVGTDVVEEGHALCQRVVQEFPETTFFTGKIIFAHEKWYQRILHNETGLSLQKRLHLAGFTMVVLPAKVS